MKGLILNKKEQPSRHSQNSDSLSHSFSLNVYQLHILSRKHKSFCFNAVNIHINLLKINGLRYISQPIRYYLRDSNNANDTASATKEYTPINNAPNIDNRKYPTFNSVKNIIDL